MYSIFLDFNFQFFSLNFLDFETVVKNTFKDTLILNKIRCINEL